MSSAESKQDYFIGVPLQVAVMYARQDVANTEHHTMDEVMTWAKERGVIRETGNPTSIPIKTPSFKRRGKKSVSAKMTVPLHVFPRDNGNVLIPIGGHYGIFKQAVHRIGKAKKGNYYRPEQWDLVSCFSADGDEWAKVPLPKDGRLSIEVLLGKINRSGQEAAYVPFAWERIEQIILPVILRVNRTCPIPPDEIKDTLHGFQDIPFGANKHGRSFVDDTLVKEFGSFAETRAYLESLKLPAFKTLTEKAEKPTKEIVAKAKK